MKTIHLSLCLLWMCSHYFQKFDSSICVLFWILDGCRFHIAKSTLCPCLHSCITNENMVSFRWLSVFPYSLPCSWSSCLLLSCKHDYYRNLRTRERREPKLHMRGESSWLNLGLRLRKLLRRNSVPNLLLLNLSSIRVQT